MNIHNNKKNNTCFICHSSDKSHDEYHRVLYNLLRAKGLSRDVARKIVVEYFLGDWNPFSESSEEDNLFFSLEENH